MMATLESNIYLKSTLANLPRLLGQLNRNPLSKSYGSFDRAYWHYRAGDISNARYQEAVLTLALLYANDFTGNHYYNNRQILEWINASLEFLMSIQNKDGSFNEWYVNEHSFVATAFAAAVLAEVMEILGERKVKQYGRCLACLKRAAAWLSRRTEEVVFNQLAGSVLALAKISRLTGEQSFDRAAKRKMEIIIERQSPEGWWSEYGGPDFGYLSLMADYLAKYYFLEKNEQVLTALKKANAFLVNFLHPNLTAGGEYMSRNTEYIIPSGFAYLTELDENARLIIDFNLAAVTVGAGIGPNSLDDRYICYILYNWLEAGIHLSQTGYRQSPEMEKFLADRRLDIFFKDSGIRVMQNHKYYLVANLYKGGTFRLYGRGKAYLDSGAEIKVSGRGYIANALDCGNEVSREANKMSSAGWLKPVSEKLMSTPTMIIFKTWQLIFGKIGFLQTRLKNFLRKEIISYHQPSGVRFRREFVLTDNSLEVTDEIGAPVSEHDFITGLKTSYNFIPSSKYFSIQEINNQSGLAEKKYFLDGSKTTLRRVFYFN